MNNLRSLIHDSAEYGGTAKALRQGNTPVYVTGCVDSQKCHFVAEIGEEYPVRLVVTYNELRAREIYEDLKLFDMNPRLYPAKDLIFFQADIKGNATVKERMSCIRELMSGKPVTIVLSLDALLDKILPPDRIRRSVIKISKDQTVGIGELCEKLVCLGYERTGQVSEPGEFAVRGGIFDIFALNDDAPVRIEFFGDEVDTIKSFDVESQRSGEMQDSVVIYPATEYILTDDEMARGFLRIREEEKKREDALRKEMKISEAAHLKHTCEGAILSIEASRGSSAVDSFITSFYDETASFLDYFDDNALIVLDEPLRLNEKGEATVAEFRESMVGRLETGAIIGSQADVICDHKTIIARACRKRLLVMSTMDIVTGISNIAVKESFAIAAKNVNNYTTGIDLLISDLKMYKRKNYRTVVITGSTARAQRLVEELFDNDIVAVFSDDRTRPIMQGEIVVMFGALHKGFEYPGLKTAVLVEGDTFGAARSRHKKKAYNNPNAIHSLHELSYGDYVVHERNGLGIYRGIEKRETDRTSQDYIKIQYGDGELYIPATGLESIQKYASADSDKKPKINKLNSPEWRKTKERVKKAVADIADELVRLYAIRSVKKGYEYSQDTEWQREFEEMFPYEETEDQLRAIEETKRDMESPKIMDRLICGDVGFGKTEVALRAAFKAVMDGKQVVVLAPTTVLCQQHYNTFTSRLMSFPVRVEMLSRFRTPAQIRETVKHIQTGETDIIIGTHRVLSKDITFRDLGLLIVDEEQRFGVTHKERIKEMKKDVDVLTLTATPIPRTMHMSLSGIREMSVLEEAPVDRLPIQTFVMEHNDEIIREAINREIARGGQVYYVYNRVGGIDEKTNLVRKLCPDVNVAFAHGQMSERELEKIMYAFVSGEIDVLVSTTIIETGIDISNVNTIIIDDADKMGLSQLYQLRGRVGRSSRTAYAFLMYKGGTALKETAEDRLKAIRENTDLGAGFRIAKRDLEIRGAGNVLGAEQSGHMAEVGYDLYCKLLDTAVRKAKGEDVSEEEFDTVIKLSVDAFIPNGYIKNEAQKLDMYKRIAMIETEEEKSDVLDELIDRFGEVPECVMTLLAIAQIKALAHKVYVTSISGKDGVFKLMLYPAAQYRTERIDGFLTKHSPEVSLTLGENPYMTYVLRREHGKMTTREAEKRGLDGLRDMLIDMKELL